MSIIVSISAKFVLSLCRCRRHHREHFENRGSHRRATPSFFFFLSLLRYPSSPSLNLSGWVIVSNIIECIECASWANGIPRGRMGFYVDDFIGNGQICSNMVRFGGGFIEVASSEEPTFWRRFPPITQQWQCQRWLSIGLFFFLLLLFFRSVIGSKQDCQWNHIRHRPLSPPIDLITPTVSHDRHR